MDTQPQPPASWNKENPGLSFEQMVAFLRKKAQTVFLKDKRHAGMVFIFDREGRMQVELIRHDLAELSVQLRSFIRANDGIFGVVHIAEGWGYFARGPVDNTLRQIIDGEIKVSELREADKQEFLMVSAQSRSGSTGYWLSEIIRDGERVELGPEKLIEAFEGQLAHLFPER